MKVQGLIHSEFALLERLKPPQPPAKPMVFQSDPTLQKSHKITGAVHGTGCKSQVLKTQHGNPKQSMQVVEFHAKTCIVWFLVVNVKMYIQADQSM